MQYDLSFNWLFNWWVYNEGICLTIELEESPGLLLLAVLLVIPFWTSCWKMTIPFHLIWCPKSCVKHRLKHADVGARLAQWIQKPCVCSVLLMSHQSTWLSHRPTNEGPSLFPTLVWRGSTVNLSLNFLSSQSIAKPCKESHLIYST